MGVLDKSKIYFNNIPIFLNFFGLFILGFSFQINAQDIIIKNDGNVVKAKIIAVNDSTIIYLKWNDLDSIIYESPKKLINQIRFSENLERNKKIVNWSYWDLAPVQNIKIGISSMAQHTLQLGYERLLSPKYAIETTIHKHLFLGFIDSNLGEVEGWGLDIGLKYFLFRKPIIREGYLVKSLLSGTYVKGILYYTQRREFDFFEIHDYWAFTGGAQIGHELSSKMGLNIDVYFGLHLYTGENTISPLDGRFTIPGKLNLTESEYLGNKQLAYSAGIKVGYYF